MIKIHFIDNRGFYIRSGLADPFESQIPGVVYKDIPEVSEDGSLQWWEGNWRFANPSDFPELVVEDFKKIPREVTMAQCRLALYDLHSIETDEQFYSLVNTLPEDMRNRALLELRTRPTVMYENELVKYFCEVMSWDRDELFIYANEQ